MNDDDLRKLAQRFLDGKTGETEFLTGCLSMATVRTVDASLDIDRQHRCGFPEVVYGEGKSTESLVQIFREFETRRIVPLATRVCDDKAAALEKRIRFDLQPGRANHTWKACG